MDSPAAIVSSPLPRAVGWTLLHSLWQCALVAGGLWLALRMLRRTSAQARYLAGCLALLMAVALPTATFITALRHPPVISSTAGRSVANSAAATSEARRPAGQRSVPAAEAAADWKQRIERGFPWLAGCWLAGVLVLSIRLLGGWAFAQHLRHRLVRPVAQAWHDLLGDVKARLGVARPVALYQSTAVESPLVIGWLRPVILFPATVLTGLPPAQLRTLLAHELAHILRHDYLVNLLQSIAETILFHHPGVWWISRKIREERENCCDDLAVAACGDEVAYAEALAHLEEQRTQSSQFALAASGGSLFARIQRLLSGGGNSASRPGRAAAGTLVIVLVALTCFQAGFITALFAWPKFREPVVAQSTSPRPAKTEKPGKAGGKNPTPAFWESEEFKRVEELGGRRADFAWENATLEKVVAEISAKLQTPLAVPAAAKEEPVTAIFRNTRVRDALQAVLARKRMGWQYWSVETPMRIYEWNQAEGRRNWQKKQNPLAKETFEAGEVAISLRANGRALTEVIASLAEQSGMAIIIPPDHGGAKVEGEWKETPLRDVLAALLPRLKLDYTVEGPARIQLVAQ